ncbi:MAG: hypothetical protein ACLQD8_05385, partial [Thermoplasmata archaeon]
MSAGPAPAIDPRLALRFRAAGESVHWQEIVSEQGHRHRLRIATLHEQPARIEERRTDSGREMVVDSGPVGALV